MSLFDLRRMVDRIFGDHDDPIILVDQRAELASNYGIIVWEGDATSFEFRYVSRSAVDILGYPAERWTSEPTFWADVVVHPGDRDDALAFCALSTGKSKPHDFIYRALHADGHVLVLHDFVRVIPGRYDLAALLRGVMIDVTEELPIRDVRGLLKPTPSHDTGRAEAGIG